MDHASILTGTLCFAFGGAVAAVITLFVCRANSAQSEASLRSERDIAQNTVKERDTAIASLNAANKALAEHNDDLIATNSHLAEEKGHLAGEQVSLQTIKDQLEKRERRIQELGETITALQSAKSTLDELAKAAEAAKIEGIKAAEQRCDELLAQKDENVKRLLEQRDADYKRQIIDKELALANELARVEQGMAEQKRLLADTEKILMEKFGAVSLQSLKSANDEFIKLAGERLQKVGELSAAELEKRQTAINELVKPVAESLEKLNLQHSELETKRVSAFEQIEKGLQNLSKDTDSLANALRKPTTRGAWSEMNLEVILKNAGLVEGQHFDVQHSTDDDETGRRRADFIVHLPNGRDLVIDSKAPLEAFMDGMNAPDEATRQLKFAAHARLVRDHVKNLSSKKYWARYKNSPDCVLMFLPTEGAYHAAIEADPALLSDAQAARVYLANPMSLVNMIHLTAYVLKEDRLKQSAQEVQAAGAELYERLTKLVVGIDSMGKSLRTTVNHYNAAVGTLDRRVLPSARRLHEMGAGSGGVIENLPEIESTPRSVLSQEARELQGAELSLLDLELSPDSTGTIQA